ncbi:MAG: hypothetical protein HXY34_00710 [Candidatus Thorarchaeota archaeon]|nr:hypothetical protein [Candidatus Thorarchaeota archaeon]
MYADSYTHHPFLLVGGYASLACLVLWLLLRGKTSRVRLVVYMSGAIILSTSGSLIVMYRLRDLIVLSPMIPVLALYVFFAVWSAFRYRPDGTVDTDTLASGRHIRAFFEVAVLYLVWNVLFVALTWQSTVYDMVSLFAVLIGRLLLEVWMQRRKPTT